MTPTDLDVEGARLRALGWSFDVTERGRGAGWQGSGVLTREKDGPLSVYVAGMTRETVERALLDGALALAGNPWQDAVRQQAELQNGAPA